MKRILFALAAMVSAVTATAATAAVPVTVSTMTPAVNLSTGGSASFSNTMVGTGKFVDVFHFVLPNSLVTGSAINIALFGNNTVGDIDFSSISLGNTLFTKVLGDNAGLGGMEVWQLNPATSFAAGTYDLVVAGKAFGVASYAGTLNVMPSAVPETATWAMMLMGFGAMGMAMRRRPAQSSTLAYA